MLRNVRALLGKDNCDVSSEDKDGMTPLHMACQNGHAKVAKMLLNRGANFLSSFISAAKKEEGTAVIKTCGTAVVKEAIFEAVRGGDRHEYLEFMEVSYLNYLQFRCILSEWSFFLRSHSSWSSQLKAISFILLNHEVVTLLFMLLLLLDVSKLSSCYCNLNKHTDIRFDL